MMPKRIFTVLMLANVALIFTGLWLWTIENPSDIVRFSRIFNVGANLVLLVFNAKCYIRFA